MKDGGSIRRSPLEGARVVNTRSPRQAQELDRLLADRGALPIPYPCIDIALAADVGPLDSALGRVAAGEYDWLVFTSANAVEAVERRLKDLAISPSLMARAEVAAVGPATVSVIADRLGITTDLCPDEYLAEELATALVARGARRVLIPQAEKAREALIRILEAGGVAVDAVIAYRTVLGSGGADVPGLLRRGEVDAVIFASPSAVDNMAFRLEAEKGDWDDLRGVCIACIGPVTSSAVGRRSLEVQVEAAGHTLADLVDALEGYFAGERRGRVVSA